MASRYPAAWMDELLSRSDLVQIVSGYVALHKKGRNYWGLCPFHGEKTPSFHVIPDRNMYYCFGGCNALTSFPTIPSKVTNMKNAFQYVGRTSGMTGSITIPASVTNMTSCFYGVKGTFDVNIYATGCYEWDELIRGGQEWNVTFHVPTGSSLKSRILNAGAYGYNSSLNIQEDL